MKIINLPKIEDPRGNLSFLENFHQVPFEVKRTYWIYDVPGGEERGGHASKTSEEMIIALSGSFDVIAHDGEKEQLISLNRSYKAAHVLPLTWRKINNFSTNAVALIISSTNYDAKDYIRDFETYKRLKNG